MIIEQWVCVNPSCRFILVMGVNMAEIPRCCPKCKGEAWDIIGNPLSCRVTGSRHQWAMGADKQGMPHLDPDQICKACGAIPVMQGVGS